ncbi:MAG: VOC family protein [Planctomycetota bacterium]
MTTEASQVNYPALVKIDLATSNLEKMAEFVTQVMCIPLASQMISGYPHYVGELGNVTLVLAPSEAAGMTPGTPGVHQIHLRVRHIAAVVERARAMGCTVSAPSALSACIYDPDEHPWMVFEDANAK